MERQLERPIASTPSSDNDDNASGKVPNMLVLTPDMFVLHPKTDPSMIWSVTSNDEYPRLDLATHPHNQPIGWTLNKLDTVMNGPQFIPSATTATLALNEQSRLRHRGFFHFLPDTADQRFGHVSDVIFTDHIWSSEDTSLWDASTWLQRLELSAVWPFKDDPVRQAAETKAEQERQEGHEEGKENEKETQSLRPQICPLLPTTKVIPICTRFLIPLARHIPATNCLNDTAVFYHAGAGAPGNPNQLCYTRAQDDDSAWLLLFDAGPAREEPKGEGVKGRGLFSVRSQAFQHRAHCAVVTSPDLRYETFTPYRDPRVLEPLSKFFCAHVEGREAARERLSEGRADGLGDVVRQLVGEGDEEAMERVEREPETWGPVWWEWGVLRERVKENVRRGWCGVFAKKARRRRKDRLQDERDRALFGF